MFIPLVLITIDEDFSSDTAPALYSSMDFVLQCLWGVVVACFRTLSVPWIGMK